MERRQRRQSLLYAALCLLLLIYLGVVFFVVPRQVIPPTPAPTIETPTGAPTPSGETPSPTQSGETPSPTVSLPPVSPNGCRCPADAQPIYDRFPHPEHTEESFAVFNFYNDGAVDENGENMTVWISMYITADAKMAAADPRFQVAFTYVYVDAVPLARGELFTFVMSKAITANGISGGSGRAPGGRIVIYYEDPVTHDKLRNEKYAGGYPTQTADAIVPISNERGHPTIPSVAYSQLLEFTLDVDPGTDVDTKAFIDYDLSAVDTIALPVYIFGGYDNRTLREATNGTSNHGFPCGKAYIGCQATHETTEGCPTQLREETTHGSVCLSAFTYCNGDLPSEVNTSDTIKNKTHWFEVCTKFDDIMRQFGVNQSLLNSYFQMVRTRNFTPPWSAALPPPLNPTPTAVLYGCAGKFLLENHCLLDGSRFTGSRLDGSQCSALNRGLCQTPNFSPVPEPSGLSCADFSCPQNPGTSCLIPCEDYSCFGFLCKDYEQVPAFDATCHDATCSVAGQNANCHDHTTDISKSKQAGCNDSDPFPYERGLIQNDYAAWARTKGERFYAFSLDEEVGGGNQQCLFSTQLDIVVFPRCNGNYVPSKK